MKLNTYHKLWFKALQEGEVEIRLTTEQETHRLRFSLYNARKKILGTNPELDNVQLTVSRDKLTITLKHYSKDPIGLAIARALGEVPEDSLEMLTEAQIAEMQEMEQRLLGKVRETPYYSDAEGEEK